MTLQVSVLHVESAFSSPAIPTGEEGNFDSARTTTASPTSFLLSALALLQVFLGSSEALSSLLCKWGNEAFLSPDWLSLEDSQSLLKLRFSGAALKVPGVKLPSVLHIQRILCLVYLMCLSQR